LISPRVKQRGGVGKAGKGDTAEARVQQELQKVMMVQARMAKRGQKMKRLRTTFDTVEEKAPKCKFYLKFNINLLFSTLNLLKCYVFSTMTKVLFFYMKLLQNMLQK
jgi:hypothetical protein